MDDSTAAAYYSNAQTLINAKEGYSTTQANNLITAITNFYTTNSETTPLTYTQSAQEQDLINQISALTDNNPEIDSQDIGSTTAPASGDLIPSTPGWINDIYNSLFGTLVTNPGAAGTQAAQEFQTFVQNNFGAFVIGGAAAIGGVILYVRSKLKKKA